MAYLTYYCSCGYPIALLGQRSGDEYTLAMYDGRLAEPRQSQPLTACPACRTALYVRGLRFLPAHQPRRHPASAPWYPGMPPTQSVIPPGPTATEQTIRPPISEQPTHRLAIPGALLPPLPQAASERGKR